MVKNEYRREMIMLRPLEDGISGFCRVEAHVARGSITYNVRAQRDFGGRLIAVLAGVRNGRWQAVAGGEVRTDALGQAGFFWEIDPRSIGALALDNYALIGVAVDGPEARLLLAGRQDKGRMIDWDMASQAVHDLLAPASAQAEPEPEQADAAAAEADEPSGRSAAAAGQSAAPDAQEQYDLTGFRLCTPVETQPDAAPAATDMKAFGVSCGEGATELNDAQLEQLVEQTVRDMVDRIAGEQCGAQPEEPAPAQPAPEPPADGDGQGEWLLEGICPPQRRWPDNCEELRRLFMYGRRVYPLNEPGYVFVHAPMADGGSCAVGVLCEDGRPSEIMYLIPGEYAAQPPAGLEGYVWRVGAGGGFWMARQDAFTGSMLYGW